MVGSPRPTIFTSPSSVPFGCTLPRAKTVVVTWNVGLSRSIAAAVVKSFMLDAGASGVCGVRSATTVPLSTSTTCRLASELRPTVLFISEFRRSPSVTPTAVPAIDGALATTLPLRFGAALRRFFARWEADVSSALLPPRADETSAPLVGTARNRMSASDATSRLCIHHPLDDGRQFAEGGDRGVGMNLHLVLERWCDSHAAFRRDEVDTAHAAALRAVDIDVKVVADEHRLFIRHTESGA